MIWDRFKKLAPFQSTPFFLICTLMLAVVVGVYNSHLTMAYATPAARPAPGVLPPPATQLPVPPSPPVAPNVNTKNIFDKAITTPKLADGAVTNSKIAPDILNFKYKSFRTDDRQNTVFGSVKVRLLIPDTNPAPETLLVFVPVTILDFTPRCPAANLPTAHGYQASQELVLSPGDSGYIVGPNPHQFTVNCNRYGSTMSLLIIEGANDKNGDRTIILESSIAYEGYYSSPQKSTRVTDHRIISMGWPAPAVIPGPR